MFKLTSLATMAAMLLSTAVSAMEINPAKVTFRGKPAPLTAFQKKRLPPGAKNPPGRELAAVLRVPEGDKPRPALVLIHTCHNSDFYLPWIKHFNSWGFATLSFSRCQLPDNKPLNAYESLEWRDGSAIAYAALNFLATNPNIDKTRIGLIGWSRVGMVPLSVLNPEGDYQFSKVKFAAAIAINPFCGFAGGPHQAPILVLSGGKDDWVDAKLCQKMSVQTAGDKFPVTVKVYPDAWHGFDIEAFGAPHYAEKEINLDGYPVGGGTLGFNAAARDDAVSTVKNFLNQHLLLP